MACGLRDVPSMKLSRLVALASFGLGVFACASPLSVAPGKDKGEDETSSAGCEGTSSDDESSAGADPSSLPTCKGTKGTSGRCISTAESEDLTAFEKGSCKGSGEVCAPEAIIRAGGVPELTKCKAVTNVEGRCFWPLAKDVVASYDLLKGATGDQCDAGMVCVPCKDPVSGEETGVCKVTAASGKKPCSTKTPGGSESGTMPKAGALSCPYTGTPIDTSAFPQDSCAAGLLCVSKDLVPADQVSQLPTCSKGLCAPKKSLAAAGMFVPKSCRSVGSREGRCLAAGLPAIAKQTTLPRAECDADEKCAPCFDPFTGEPTGACTSVPCDKPAEPAKTFARCCGGKGSCVPSSLVPAGDRDNFDDEASGCVRRQELCLPTELATGDLKAARPCSFGGADILGIEIAEPFKGACVANCFDTFPEPPQANCAGGTVCVPCDELPAGTPACGK
jgi:hypothetical protein